jgi:hypothetical protein
MPVTTEAPNVVRCRACGEFMLWAEVDHYARPVALNLEPDSTGRFILLRDDRSALRISDEQIVLCVELAAHGVEPDPETSARRYREHQSTCDHRFPMYNIEGAFRPAKANAFQERRERLREVKLQLEQGR